MKASTGGNALGRATAIASAFTSGLAQLKKAPYFLQKIGSITKNISGSLAIVGTGAELSNISNEKISTFNKIAQSAIVIGSNISAAITSGALTTSLAGTGVGITATGIVNYGVGEAFGAIKNGLINLLK